SGMQNAIWIIKAKMGTLRPIVIRATFLYGRLRSFHTSSRPYSEETHLGRPISGRTSDGITPRLPSLLLSIMFQTAEWPGAARWTSRSVVHFITLLAPSRRRQARYHGTRSSIFTTLRQPQITDSTSISPLRAIS